MAIEDTLQSLGLSLPAAPTPQASYIPAVRAGNLVFSSGQLPTKDGSLAWQGEVPEDVTPEQAYQAARVAALNALAAIGTVIPSLDHIRRVVRVTGYVQSADGFTAQPEVVNGASDLLLQLFGDAGKHSRLAIGVAELPRDSPVEIDLIVEVSD